VVRSDSYRARGNRTAAIRAAPVQLWWAQRNGVAPQGRWGQQPPPNTPGQLRASARGRGGSRQQDALPASSCRFRAGPPAAGGGSLPPRFPGPRRPCSCPLTSARLRRRQSLDAGGDGQTTGWRGSAQQRLHLIKRSAARTVRPSTSTLRTHWQRAHKARAPAAPCRSGPGRSPRAPAAGCRQGPVRKRHSRPHPRPLRRQAGPLASSRPSADRQVERPAFLAQLRWRHGDDHRVGAPGAACCARRP